MIRNLYFLNLLGFFSLMLVISMKCTAEAAIQEIDNASDEVEEIIESLKKESQSSYTQKTIAVGSINRLEAALKRGKKINSLLKDQVEKYKSEKEELLRIQTTLSSGLIGALVTMVVAIAGAFISARNSKPERDLERLNVIEKAMQLKKEGTILPKDIELNYIRK